MFHFLSPYVSAPANLHKKAAYHILFEQHNQIIKQSPCMPPRKSTSMSLSRSPILLPSKLPSVNRSKSPSSHCQIVTAHLHRRAQHTSIKEPITLPLIAQHNSTTIPHWQPQQGFMKPPLNTPCKSALWSHSALLSKSLSVSPLKSPTVSPVVLDKLF